MVVVFDLDDTLYDEIDFVKSGFKEVAKYLHNDEYYSFMLEQFYQYGSGKVFNELIEKFNLDISLKKLIEVYRFHKPEISLPQESLELLSFSKKYNRALISDGHYITQQNKFIALGLNEYIDYCIFTDFYHTKKPELKPFEMVMQQYPNKKYIYISDNPKKDFKAPNRLNWSSIRYKNSVGIYKEYKSDALYEVEKRAEIVEILRRIDNGSK